MKSAAMLASEEMAEVASEVELSIVLPCLDEAETLGAVIDRAQRFLQAYGVPGEVIVADNGSTDGSVTIAEQLGASVVHVQDRGYGAALMGGIKAARGRYVAMGDADQSYDFMGLMPFLDMLRGGSDLVMGNRFMGGIGRGAMPPLHRYLGNPVLSFAGRLFSGAPVGDFHCGLRVFRREAILGLDLNSSGMEFASEMVVRAHLRKLRIDEVPTTLAKDGRSRPPHLRSWRDGWRHLKFLLIYSPRWLYIYPGLTLLAISLAAFLYLLPGFQVLGSARLGVHTLAFAGFGVLVGVQLASLGLIASVFGVRESYWFSNGHLDRIKRWMTVDRGVLIGGALVLIGFAGALFAFWNWAESGYGDLSVESTMRIVIPASVIAVVGIQTAFVCFLFELLDRPPRQ
jgi:glycosyltransferase involved in cell wall biosynthesis